MNRPALDYFGGKWKHANKIIAHFPPHKTFIDVFCGAASITLRKPRSKNEIINDLHSEVIDFFKVLRDKNGELKELLEKTPYAREEYARCREPSTDVLEQARRTVVKAWFGIGDSLDNKTGFRVSLTQSGSVTEPWVRYVDYLPLYADRLRGVIVENLDYREIFERYDNLETLFYLDPPYLKETRSHKHAYLHDWELPDHEELLSRLPRLIGRFVLSGYSGGPYIKLPWKKVDYLGSSQGNQNREETLWIK